MSFFGKKNLEKTRRETFITLFDLAKKIEKLEKKATKDKFKAYLKELNDEFSFSVNNNTKISSKLEKKLLSNLDDIFRLLNHEVWHGKKIKKKLKQISDIKYEILS